MAPEYRECVADQTPWANGRLRAAWAAQDWSLIFTEYRRLADISQTALGTMLDMYQGAVSLIESGKRQITHEDVIARITEGLKVPDELRGLPERHDVAWSPDPELCERVAHAQRTGKTDIKAAEWIAHVLAQHREAEDAIGGKDLRVVVRSQLDAVTYLLPGASGDAADMLLLLAAEHAHWLSWVSFQDGRRGPALSWLDLANGWALDAGSADMRSFVARVRSFYTLKHGDPARALRIADTALLGGDGLNPASASIATHAACMAAAGVGENDRSRALAEEAHALALRASEAADRPAWLYWLNPQRARLNLADAAYAVRDWSTAADLFGEVVDQLNGFPRDQAVYLGRLEDARRRS